MRVSASIGALGIRRAVHTLRPVVVHATANPHHFAKLRKLALNILKNEQGRKRLELFNNCMNLNNILNYVGVT